MTEFLYCLLDSEGPMRTTPQDVLEHDIEPWILEADEDAWWVIEEWTTFDPVEHAPDIDWLIEWIADHASDEGDENYWESWKEAGRQDDVHEALDNALRLMASKITYRMAADRIRTLKLYRGDDGNVATEPFQVETFEV